MINVRHLSPAHIKRILEIQKLVISALPNRDVLQPSTEEFITYCLSGGGIGLGAFSRSTDALIAYRIAYFPIDRDFNLAKNRLPDSELRYVAHLDTTAVLPNWRRLGIADQLNAEMIVRLKASEMKHLLCTVSPYNPGSMLAIFKTGSRPVRLIRIFEGKLRFLCYRPLPSDWQSVASERLEIPWSNINKLGKQLSSGFVATGLKKRENELIMSLEINRSPLKF